MKFSSECSGKASYYDRVRVYRFEDLIRRFKRRVSAYFVVLGKPRRHGINNMTCCDMINSRGR